MFDFVADDVAGVGGGDVDDLHAVIGKELTVLHAEQTVFLHVLVFNPEILALGGNAPSVNVNNPGIRVKSNFDVSEVAAAGT